MKKIIRENQQFSEGVNLPGKMPYLENVNALEQPEMPMSGNKFFDYNPVGLGVQEWNRVLAASGELAFDGCNREEYIMNFPRLLGDQLALHNEVTAMDQPHSELLCELAEESIRELYDIGDEVEFEFEVRMANAVKCESCTSDEEALVADEKLKPHVVKRQIINAITHGSSVYLWENLFFNIQEELNAISPERTKKYQDYSRAINLGNWYVGAAMCAGGGAVNPSTVELIFKDGKWVIKIIAPNLPLILHEASKGVMEILSYWGLPEVDSELDSIDAEFIPNTARKLTTQELELVLKVADDYSHERWYYYIGPSIWTRLLYVWNIEPNQIAEKLEELYKLEPYEFNRVLLSLVYDLSEPSFLV